MNAQIVSSPKSEFRELLECPICVHVFKDPKQLNCGHTFCLSCVEKMTAGVGSSKVVECPHCRKNTPVPRDGLSTNFIVGDLVAKMEDVDLKEDQMECIMCQKAVLRAELAVCKSCSGMRLCCVCAVKGHKEHEVDLFTSITGQRRRQKAQAYVNEQAEKCVSLLRSLAMIRAESGCFLSDVHDLTTKKNSEIKKTLALLADKDKHFSVDELAAMLGRVSRIHSAIQEICARASEMKSGIEAFVNTVNVTLWSVDESHNNEENLGVFKTMLDEANLQDTSPQPSFSPSNQRPPSAIFSEPSLHVFPSTSSTPTSAMNAFVYQPSTTKNFSHRKSRKFRRV